MSTTPVPAGAPAPLPVRRRRRVHVACLPAEKALVRRPPPLRRCSAVRVAHPRRLGRAARRRSPTSPRTGLFRLVLPAVLSDHRRRRARRRRPRRHVPAHVVVTGRASPRSPPAAGSAAGSWRSRLARAGNGAGAGHRRRARRRASDGGRRASPVRRRTSPCSCSSACSFGARRCGRSPSCCSASGCSVHNCPAIAQLSPLWLAQQTFTGLWDEGGSHRARRCPHWLGSDRPPRRHHRDLHRHRRPPPRPHPPPRRRRVAPRRDVASGAHACQTRQSRRTPGASRRWRGGR